tara:strand:- start:1340 stop:2167 length:828 start_codon:yes stop_codon:yes gene_type:complete
MSKHNKKRNTGFIYEALVREVVKQSLKKDRTKRNMIISILKEHFNKSTLLYQDLHLYKSILETRNVEEKFALRLLNEVKYKKTRMDKKRLFNEQSNIIARINKQLSNSVFTNYVPSYRYLASIGTLFGDNLNPKQKVLLEERLLEHMTVTLSVPKASVIGVNNAVIKSFTKRFNNTYGTKLLEEQKELINKFINSATPENRTEFKLYIDREIARLREALEKNRTHKEIISDVAMNSKFSKVRGFLNKAYKHPLDDKLILKIAQVQQLVKEIQAND